MLKGLGSFHGSAPDSPDFRFLFPRKIKRFGLATCFAAPFHQRRGAVIRRLVRPEAAALGRTKTAGARIATRAPAPLLFPIALNAALALAFPLRPPLGPKRGPFIVPALARALVAVRAPA